LSDNEDYVNFGPSNTALKIPTSQKRSGGTATMSRTSPHTSVHMEHQRIAEGSDGKGAPRRRVSALFIGRDAWIGIVPLAAPEPGTIIPRLPTELVRSGCFKPLTSLNHPIKWAEDEPSDPKTRG
jgi:hypothetical protein